MAVNYTNLRAVAERLIGENGRSLTLVRRDQGNPTDPAKPWRDSTGASDVTLVVTGVFIDFEQEDTDGTLVRRGDKRVLAAASEVETVAGASFDELEDYDYILDGTDRWDIVKVDVIEPGSLRVLYDIQVRK